MCWSHLVCLGLACTMSSEPLSSFVTKLASCALLLWCQTIGEPSSAFMEQMGKEEKARVEAQRAALGPEGLEKCRVQLEEATANNEVCVWGGRCGGEGGLWTSCRA